MKRSAYITAALFLLCGGAQADQGWQDFQNTNGFVSQLPAWNCPLQSYSDGTVSCYPPTEAVWPVANVRWYCVDGTNGNDLNVGYSDISSADCGTKALKTIAALGLIFPRQCSGHKPVVEIAQGTYTDGLDSFLSGVIGCAGNFPLVVATGTNPTANAVAFAGDINDRINVGAVTVTGLNASGYNPTGSPTNQQIQFIKVGGGSPSFPSEPAAPLGWRIRFAYNTTTAALRNYCANIVKVIGSDTLFVAALPNMGLGLPAVPVSSDVAFIEQNGVTVGNTYISPVAELPGTNTPTQALSLQVAGIGFSSLRVYEGRSSFSMLTASTGVIVNGAIQFEININYTDENGNVNKVGGGRLGGFLTTVGPYGPNQVAGTAIVSAGAVALNVHSRMQFQNGSYAGGGLFISGLNGDPEDPLIEPNLLIGSRVVNSQPASRVTGSVLNEGVTAGVSATSSRFSFGRLQITGQGSNPAIGLQGTNTVAVTNQLTGSSGNSDVGLSLLGARGTTVLISSNPTVTGTTGDVRLCDGNIITWTQAAAGIIDACGNQFIGYSGAPISIEPSFGTVLNGGPVTVVNMSGGGTQCVQVNNAGVLSPTGSSCGSGSGTVTSVTASSPIFSSGGTTPNITEQGAIVSGSTSTTAQDLGAISTAMLACSTSGGVCTVDGVTVTGGLAFNGGTATETLGSFSCGANTFVSSSSTSGLACTQPAFSNLSGSATCAQLPALTGDVTTSAGSCTTTIPTKGKVLVSATDPTIDYLDTKFESTSGNIAVTHITGPPEFVNLNVITAGLFDGPQSASVSANYVTYAPGVTGYGTFAIPYSTARTTADIQNAAMEVPVGFAATKQRVIANVTSNSLSSGGGGSSSTACQSTQNSSGSGVFAGGIGGIPNASTGVFDSGIQTVSSSSATDTWGIACGGSSPLGGSVNMTITVMVWR